MKPYTVEVLERAWRELAWENASWNLSLPRAKPDRLLEVFESSLSLLAEGPRIGPEDLENAGHRRWLCRTGRVGFWLYYRVDDANQRIQVVSFWSAQRRPPEFED